MKIALFDMDGVVVETEHLKAAAHAAAVEHFGGIVPDTLYPTVMGQTHSNVRSVFIEAGGVEIDPLEYTRVYQDIYFAWLAQTPRLVPGVMALIECLRANRFCLGLVTSSSILTANRVLDHFDLRRLFEVHIFAEDVKCSKPDPEPYRLGWNRLTGENPGQVFGVAFEDSQAGVSSAAEAGLAVIGLRHKFNHGQDFSRASLVLESLEDTSAILAAIVNMQA